MYLYNQILNSGRSKTLPPTSGDSETRLLKELKKTAKILKVSEAKDAMY